MAVDPLYDSTLLGRIRARYEGRDGTGPEDGHRLVVDVMAREFGVHSNSIFHWAKTFGWRRPDWYRQRRPKRPNATPEIGPVRVRLLALLGELAAAGAAVPSNRALAPRFGCSSSGIVHALRALARRGEIRSEANGPLRRFKVGASWTAWSDAPIDPRPRVARPTLERPPGERRATTALQAQRAARDDRLLILLKRLAAAGAAFPGDAELAVAVPCPKNAVLDALKRLAAAGEIAIEHRKPNQRRATLKDGAALGWSRGGTAAPLPDLAVGDAVRALRRMGLGVFDIAVVTGRAWGVSWSVDGRILGRAALIALADQRRAAAIVAMVGGA